MRFLAYRGGESFPYYNRGRAEKLYGFDPWKTPQLPRNEGYRFNISAYQHESSMLEFL
jgi:hypothetical protein